jgi:hypothetical protein
MAIAIALSLQLSIKAQSKTDTSGENLQERLASASEWENAVLTRSLVQMVNYWLASAQVKLLFGILTMARSSESYQDIMLVK